MKTVIGLEWFEGAIKGGYCVIHNAYGEKQYWSKGYWKDFLFCA